MPVHLALDRIQAIGVRTAVVQEKEVARTVRVTAAVASTEEGVSEVHVRTAGFVEQVHVAQTGQPVAKGQPLFSMYSPEIFQAQSELLAASRWLASTPPESGTGAAGAARRRLELLGMSSKDIDGVLQRKEALRAVPVVAPRAGVVTAKSVVLGSYVTPEMTLYEIRDLSKVYVLADVFPKDVALLAKGTAGRFVPSRAGSAPVDALVDLVYPLVDTAARTTRVRLTVKNGDGALRPGDFGSVIFEAPKRRVLVVPRDAVVDTGASAYVFVVGQDGVFQPHVVTLAGSEGDSLLVQEGIAPGARVVSGATFLVDSESRLLAAVKSVEARPSPAPPGAATSSEKPKH